MLNLNNNKTTKLAVGLIRIGRVWGKPEKAVPTEEESLKFLRGAFDLGIRFFDTAPAYGFSEERLGKFLISLSNDELKELTIATKFGENWDFATNKPFRNYTFESLKNSIDNSLFKLNNKIDVLQLHGTTPEVLKSNDLYKAIDYAKTKGIKFFGASLVEFESARIVCDSKVFSYIQLPFNLLNTEDQRYDEIIKMAKDQDIKVITNRPVGMGKFLYNDSIELPKNEKNKKLIECYKYIINSKPDYILSGTSSIEHLIENIEAFNNSLG